MHFVSPTSHTGPIERRKLFAARSYSSLWEYCTKELGYCPASAQLRIDAMRLLKDLPEVETKIESGALSLSVVAQSQKYFRQEAVHAQPLNLQPNLNYAEFIAYMSKLSLRHLDPTQKTSRRPRLQLDHKIALALGGETSANNLQLHCFQHNQLKAAKDFGLRKMEPFWNKTRNVVAQTAS